jgi:signal transduction histidine kinase
MVDEDEDGIIYVANENGLLEFDGSEWLLHKLPDFSNITILKVIQDRIFVSGISEFGYFQRDSLGYMQYHSLKKDFVADTTITDIWFIEEAQGKVYFNAYEAVIAWDGEVVKQLPIKNAHTFSINNQLLFSVYGKGLALLQGDSLRYVNQKFKFANDAAFSIIPGDKEESWSIFTSENGAYNFNTKDFSAKKAFPGLDSAFKANSIYKASQFHDSLFAIATWAKGGIIIANRDGQILQSVTKEDGLLSNGYNGVFEDRRGNLWCANIFLGISHIRWENDKSDSFQPKTVVRYVDYNDSTFFINQNKQTFETYEGKNAITFHYATPSYLKDELEYSFYLDGYENTWSEWSSDVKKEYTNLSGGDYTFYVKARNIYDESLRIADTSLKVSIPTPWYNSIYFYALATICFAGLIFGFIKIRTERLSKMNKNLETIITERTQELEEQKAQLKVANEELTIINSELDNFVYRSSHDLVAPLKSMRGLIHIAKIEQDPDAIMQYLDLLNTSVNKLEEFIRSIMDYSTNSKKPVDREHIDFNDLLDSIVGDIKYYDKADRIELIRNLDDSISFVSDAKRLKIVLSNLITNSVKYHNFNQEKPHIEVETREEGENIVVKVKDNGLGIAKEHHERIYDMFYRASEGEGSGLGLYIVKDTLAILRGDISFESAPWIGTTFTLTFPKSL